MHCVSVYCVKLSWTIKVFEAVQRPSTAAIQQVAFRRGNVLTLAED